MMKDRIYFRQLILIIVLSVPLLVMAQTTEFTYQGKLVDGALPANANYDFEFRLFAADSGGAVIVTQTRLGVPVANGIFTVALDFGGQFDGSARWLEIAVKPASSPNPLTVLTPRQPFTSTPHSIRSLSTAKADVATNSLQLGGVGASQYVLTTDARMTDARSPLPNSSNYVQNTAAPQSSSNFNISGNGSVGGTLSANTLNATAAYSIGGNRILSNAGSNNLFAGVGAGQSNTTGSANSFFGRNAGNANTAGQSNAFFGDSAGASNNNGDQNSFFGFFGGLANTSGVHNSYFGYRAGQLGTTGEDNTFFGYRAGFANIADGNSFFGASAGDSNTIGSNNSYFGYQAGFVNNGSNNAFFGDNAGAASTMGASNSFFGHNAGRLSSSNNNSFFGSSAGGKTTTGGANSFFGLVSGSENTTGGSNSFFGVNSGLLNSSGDRNSFFGDLAGAANRTGSNNAALGYDASVSADTLSFATAIGAESRVLASNTIALGRSDGSDKVVVYGLGAAGSTDVCRNASNQLSTCSSSLRYKASVQRFNGGLDIVHRLRPITFNWREGGMRDVGFAAEDVEKVEPLLVTYNDKGEIEGVKYRQLTTVLVNSVGELQMQIEQQQKQIQQQQQTINSLRELLCRQTPTVEICKGRQR